MFGLCTGHIVLGLESRINADRLQNRSKCFLGLVGMNAMVFIYSAQTLRLSAQSYTHHKIRCNYNYMLSTHLNFVFDAKQTNQKMYSIYVFNISMTRFSSCSIQLIWLSEGIETERECECDAMQYETIGHSHTA